jgi:hypothetical protein
MNTRTLIRSSATTAMLLVMSACSREADRAVHTPVTDTDPITAETLVDDVKLTGVGTTAAASADSFMPGQTIQLSMSVDDAPQGTIVTTYWYGPDNRRLAYESKPVNSGQEQLSFMHDNTSYWRPGTYRAEVWVGDEKVEEETFQVTAG